MTRKHWLLIAAAVLSSVLVQSACGLDGAAPETMERAEALTSVQSDQLDQGLPGCLEALSNDADASRRWDRVQVARLTDAPSLAVLVVDGHQMCVDNLDELETWMETGVWPQIGREGTDPSEALPRDRGDVAHKQMGNHSLTTRASLGRDDDEPHRKSVDDSNPLPPYPNPMQRVQ